MAKVKLINTTNGRVAINVPELQFKREWISTNSSVLIDKEILEELLYDNGVRYMIDSGMLYIEDLDTKQDLGLEPMDATEPVNIIVLTDKERRKYMVNLSLDEFKTKVKNLNHEQVLQLADYAIANKLMDFDKVEFLRELCGKDIVKAIRLNQQNQEE